MREIKFRAWDGEKMVEVAELHLNTKELLVDDEEWLSMCHSPLMQFTGLHDKNGREIYDSDIVKYHMVRSYGDHYDPVTLGFIGTDWDVDADIIGKVSIWPSNGVMMTNVITNDPDMFCKKYPVPKRWHVTHDCEVIGNIFENPELLEGKHE